MDVEASIERRTSLATKLVGGLLATVFGLSATLTIQGAVIGQGELAAASHVKTIAHPFGGILRAVYVHDGDRVHAGQILMRLDTGVAGVSASQARASVEDLLARKARLEAERDGSDAVRFPSELTRSSDPEIRAILAREQRQFDLKRAEHRSSLAMLRERIHQYMDEVASYAAQIDAGRRQSALIEPELASVRALYDRHLVTISRRNELERTAVQLSGSRAALEGNVAQMRANIAEIREQMTNLVQTARADAATELAQVTGQLNDQITRRASAADVFDRTTIRAPQTGLVDKVAYFTIGSAIPANQPILQIVPDRDRMVIEGRISPADIDKAAVGQATRISFPTMNRQVTPDVAGTLRFVSPAPVEDPRTGQSYYRVSVDVDAAALTRATKVRLLSGTPAELFIETGSRSVLSYLFKPLRDQFSHALREG